LYSNDPELADLREDLDELGTVGVVSKWTYALKRIFDGDEVALLRAIKQHGGRLS
jgi:plasmid replication initiation protein